MAALEISHRKSTRSVWEDLLSSGPWSSSEIASSKKSVESIGKDWRSLNCVSSDDGEIVDVDVEEEVEEEEDDDIVEETKNQRLTESMESLVEGLLRWGEEGGGGKWGGEIVTLNAETTRNENEKH